MLLTWCCRSGHSWIFYHYFHIQIFSIFLINTYRTNATHHMWWRIHAFQNLLCTNLAIHYNEHSYLKHTSSPSRSETIASLYSNAWLRPLSPPTGGNDENDRLEVWDIEWDSTGWCWGNMGWDWECWDRGSGVLRADTGVEKVELVKY